MSRWIRSLLVILPLTLVAGYANAKSMQRFDPPVRTDILPALVVMAPMPPRPRPMPPHELKHKFPAKPRPHPRPMMPARPNS